METESKHSAPQGRYEVVGTIGVGATSRVDKAHDTLIDRIVALKTFGQGFGSPELQKEFLREAQILGRLSHPNIVSIYDLGADQNGSAYLVMEYVPGKTLESVIATQEAVPLSRVAVWAADLANALNRAHRAGVIHGDVKPANIFVTDEGHIKLGDFGIARFATQLSGSGRLVGTPAYLSPEQIKGESQDHRSDIFSLGIILYQLGTGVRPFDGSSVAAVCAQIVASEPALPSHHNPALPKEFDRIVMRCLAKDPAARYATGESLAASLYPFARNQPERAPAPRREKVSWWKKPLCRRDAWISAVAAAVMLLAVATAHRWLAANVALAAQTANGSSSPATSTAASTYVEVSLPELPITSDATSIATLQNLNAPTTGLADKQRIDQARMSLNSHSQKSGGKPSKSTAAGANPTSLPKNDLASGGASLTSGTTGNRNSVSPPLIAAQVPLTIEIASAIEGETIAVYADQKLVATFPLTVTSSGEVLHVERPLSPGPHEFRVALYRPDQSLHLDRGGLAELQSAGANVLSIRVVRRAKMLVKRDAALEILWPGAPAPRNGKQGNSVADAANVPQTGR